MATNILNLLSKGVITLGKTTEKDNYVLFVVAADKKFAVPMLKTKSTTFAYIGDEVDVEDYASLCSVVDAINKNKVYKGIYSYRPISKNAPEHSHAITSIVAGGIDGTKTVQPKDLKKIMKALGYDYLEASGPAGETKKKDYSSLLENPEIKAHFNKDEADIKKVGATFESLPLEMRMAFESIVNGHSSGCILEGPTGTGKSFAINIMANKASAPLLNVQVTEGTTIDDLVGSYVPDGEGGFKFVEGPLLKAYSSGFWVKIDEVNFGNAGVLSVINQFGDGTSRLTFGGKTYHLNPNFVMFLTMNPGYEGTAVLNVALKNRFCKVDVPELTKKEFSERLMGYSKNTLGNQVSFEFCSKLYDFSKFIEKESCSSKWHENAKFSIRNAQRLCDALLMKKRSFEEFTAIISINYLNDLSMDNDNSEKLSQFKNDKTLIEQIRGIYETYDFAEVKTVEVTDDFNSFFSEDEEETKTTSGKADDDMVEDLLSRFGD